jgi:predicted nuclease with TOPRIM domain
MDADLFETPQIVGTLGVALLATAYSLKKYLKGWNLLSAENTVINLLREELDRMSSQNRDIASELNKLQLDLINLHKEIQILTVENNRLYTQVNQLNHQVERLKSILGYHQIDLQNYGVENGEMG